MGKFLMKILVFSLLLMTVCVLYFGLQNWLINHNANFKFSQENKFLIAGHSHAECAYNDSLITNFKNIATSGESYFYTYQKLKEVLKQNNSFEIVFVEFTNNQIDGAMDTWIWGDKYISKFYPKYGSFIDFDDTSLLLKHNFSSLMNNFSVLQKRNFMDILKREYDYRKDLGGYIPYKETRVHRAIMNQIETKKNTPVNSISQTNLSYLQKLILLCKQYNKKVVFIRSPQHSKLSMRKNEPIFLEVYNNKFKGVPFLDFNDFHIPDYGYKDLEHLNYKGAEIISAKLDSILRNQQLMDILLKDGSRRRITN